jgi:clan AA aspartic protease
MIFGLVRGHSPRVRLPLPGLNGPVDVELIVDTGFEGDLALPPSLIRRLDVVFIERRLALMPDGREEEVSAYEAELEWDEESRPVEVLELDGRPLLGMILLSTSHLHMEGSEGGEIVIEPL